MHMKSAHSLSNFRNRCDLSRAATALAALAVLCVAASAQSAVAGSGNITEQTMVPTAIVGPTESQAPATPSQLLAESRSEPDLGSASDSSALPDAPLPQLRKLNTPPATPETAQHIAPIYTSIIPAGYQAKPQTARQQIIMGARDLYSFDDLAAIVLSAAYEQIANSSPNYGSNGKAFGQRVGAAAARETSQGVFYEVVLAPLFHEDARYYVLGPSKNVVRRTFYAVTRPLVTRTNGGASSINAAQLLGYLGAAALTPTYYPQVNRNFHDTASTYGTSIGGAALGDFVSEFADDVLQAVHLKRLP